MTDDPGNPRATDDTGDHGATGACRTTDAAGAGGGVGTSGGGTSGDTGEALPVDQRERTRSAVPFLAAGGAAVLVLLGIVVLTLARPAQNLSDTDQVAQAVRNFATAQADSDADRRASTACTGFDAARSPLGPDAVGKKVEIAQVADIGIDGDRARATVTSRSDGRETTAPWALVRGAGTWLVCQ